MKALDLTGKKFSNLTVVRRDGKTPAGKAVWECRCDCGKSVRVTSQDIRRNDGKHTISCGCQKGLRIRKNVGQASFNRIIRQYKRDAIRRGHTFSLSDSDVEHITKQNCFYCGTSPNQIISRFQSKYPANGEYRYNGIDRVDNTRGYELSNVVPCCKKCNQAKMNLPLDDFKNLIKSIFAHWASLS